MRVASTFGTSRSTNGGAYATRPPKAPLGKRWCAGLPAGRVRTAYGVGMSAPQWHVGAITLARVEDHAGAAPGERRAVRMVPAPGRPVHAVDAEGVILCSGELCEVRADFPALDWTTTLLPRCQDCQMTFDLRTTDAVYPPSE